MPQENYTHHSAERQRKVACKTNTGKNMPKNPEWLWDALLVNNSRLSMPIIGTCAARVHVLVACLFRVHSRLARAIS